MSEISIGNQMIEYSSMLPMQKSIGSEAYKYRGSSGLCYKYDLSNLSDRQSYEIDLSAQLNDSLKNNSDVETDRRHGQYGGGIQ